MAGEEQKELARRAMDELFNKGNLQAADELYSSNFVSHEPTEMFGDVRGPQAVKEMVSTFRSAFPDMRTEFEEIIAEGDKVAVRWNATGTHQGELMGVAPTNRPIHLTGITILRIANNKIQESWNSWDALGMMQQLGIVPTMTQRPS